MKATLAMLACLSMVGFLTAAEVTGNNTAVVIQKAATPSSTGFQFLCVPVSGLDIADTGVLKTLTLAELLPPELYTSTARVTRAVDGDNVEYTIATETVEGVTVNKWVVASSAADANSVTLNPGEVFWLNTQSKGGSLLASTTNTEAVPVVFCGQALEGSTVSSSTAGIAAYGNTYSEAKPISTLVPAAGEGDIIFVIDEGRADYKQYHYSNDKWLKPATDANGNLIGGPMVAVTDADVIAAGEAFYYYNAQ